MKAFMKMVVLTNICTNKGNHKSVVTAINVINVTHVIAIKVLRFIAVVTKYSFHNLCNKYSRAITLNINIITPLQVLEALKAKIVIIFF